MAKLPHKKRPFAGIDQRVPRSRARAAKVVDIFGNDTMTIVEVAV